MARRFKENPIYTPMYNKISQRRADVNISMKVMATKIGLPAGSYGVIESGHCLPSWELLAKICKVLHVTPVDLYDKALLELMESHDKAIKMMTVMREAWEKMENTDAVS